MKLSQRKKLWAFAVASGAVAFQFLPSGCADYYTNAALNMFDFCSVFNCQGGTYFDLCDPVPLLRDCPQEAETDGG